ncbi:MAG: branched-chain amino acid ABC transporter permease [Candidatus Dormiibacterota bacterium]
MKWLAAFVVVLVVLLSVPVWAPNFWVSVGIQTMIFATFAMSLDLVLGYGGLPTLGHAALYGAGAYAYAFWAVRFEPSLPMLLLTGMAGGAVVALLIGGLALRARGIYFLMLTLSLGQILWALAAQWTEVTGGTDGLNGVARPSIPVLFDVMGSLRAFYVLVVLIAAVGFVVLTVLVRSPFGRTLAGARENERKMSAMGYPVLRYRLAAFVIAGALAGIAGASTAAFNFAATPGLLFWTTSGLVLVSVVLGGTRSLVGPVIGALVIQLLLVALPSITERWQMAIGAVCIAVVLLLPRGLARLPRRLKA